jgi:hypothetical protein
MRFGYRLRKSKVDDFRGHGATTRNWRSSDIILRCLFAECSLGVRKSLSANISRISGSAVGFEMTARRESRLGVA